jgi:hypothetical protein
MLTHTTKMCDHLLCGNAYYTRNQGDGNFKQECIRCAFIFVHTYNLHEIHVKRKN